MFLKLAGRRVLVVGGGPVAASKLAALLAAGADVTVVAPEVDPEIARAPACALERRGVRGRRTSTAPGSSWRRRRPR